jgi:nucleoid-associated protein YgaU
MQLISSARLLAIASIAFGLVSCQNGQNPFNKSAGAEEPYVGNYANDGGYNPYPDQPGHVVAGAPTYEQPVAPVEADPYAFNAPTSAASKPSSSPPKKVASTSSRPKSSSTKKTTAKKSSGSSSHTVGKGDTLYGIALKNKTTVAKIKAANSLKSDLIRPGQKLKLR